MANIVISVIAKVAKYLVGPILHHGRYLFCFNNFAGDLPNAKKELEEVQKVMMERAERAIKRTEELEPNVKKWLEDVNSMLEEVQKLQEKIEKSKGYTCSRYSLAKEVERETQKMIKLKNDSKFEPFSQSTDLPGMAYVSSENFMLFKSTKLAYDKLLEAIKANNRMIGLHGMGGSGKTTLVKEVGKEVEVLKLFDKVVWTTVSQTPNVRKIQGEIADQLDLKLDTESELGRSRSLLQRLRNGNTLLILDDVWRKLEFEDIGIPPPNEDNKGCNVLLTTRRIEICTQMRCQSTIELALLSQDEAWSLFKHYANITNESSDDLKDVGWKIADECMGLPIAIAAVGSTLRGKGYEEWGLALARLEESQPIDVASGLSPYACLELSYNNLTNEVAQTLFLLCSIYPEDFDIVEEDLVRFGKAIEPLGTIGTMERARKEMHAAINILVDCYLLLRSNKKGCIKMHDMVRDVALWIASKKGKAILVEPRLDPRKLVESENIRDKTTISLWYLNSGEIPIDQLNFPTLEILSLHSYEDLDLPDAYLEWMKKLKILAFRSLYEAFTYELSGDPYFTLSIPQSIESSANLQTLCLRGYNLSNISVLESLKGLEILDLRGSSFNELPSGITTLKKLKLFDLYDCKIEQKNTYEVVGRCSQLEELDLFVIGAKDGSLENISLARLKRYFLIHADANLLLSVYMFLQLLETPAPSRVLFIQDFNANARSFASSSIKDVFIISESLCLVNLQGGNKNIIPAMDQQGMNYLTCLVLEACSEISCLVDKSMTMTRAVFSKLATLWLRDMQGLEQVFHDPSSCCSLEKLEELWMSNCPSLVNISFPKISNLCRLKILRIKNCQMLTSLFKPFIVRTLKSLEKLKISGCNKLKNIIEEDEEEEGNVQSLTSLVLPNLRVLTLKKCERLEDMWPESYHPEFPNLNEMKCTNCPRLSANSMRKMVMSSDMPHDITAMEKNTLWVIDTNQLCDQTTPMALRALNLTSLHLSHLRAGCIIEFQIEGESRKPEQPLNSELSQLDLWNLPNLTLIWKGPTNLLRLQRLQRVSVRNCPKLKAVFSSTIVKSLPMLSSLSVANCEELEKIMVTNDDDDDDDDADQKAVCFPRLWDIEVGKCNNLRCLFSKSIAHYVPCLEYLVVWECSKLEKIFEFENEADGEQAMLQKLGLLRLVDLPNFTETGFKFSSDLCLDMENCPKYNPIGCL